MLHLKFIKFLLTTGILLVYACASPVYAEKKNTHKVQDLAYGVSLFNFFQEKYFSAITELMVAEHYQRIKSKDKNPYLLLGGLYLSYDLHYQSSDVFKNLLLEDEIELPAAIEDQARFLLAKNHYHDKDYAQAEELLISIKNGLSQDSDEEKLFLLNTIFLRNKDYPQALKTLDYFSDASVWKVYAQFNTASFLIQQKDEDIVEQGFDLLEELGSINSINPEKQIIRDKANLALAYVALRDENSSGAIKYFNKIRIKGIEANKALLGIGWARYREKEYQEALIPWMHLASSQTESDLAVQEAYISIPYAFEKMQDEEQALHQYGLAIDSYKIQLSETSQLMEFIKTPQFLEQLNPGSLGGESTTAASVIKNLDSRLTQYMLPLLSSHEFQHAAKSYREILHLRYMLNHWQNNIPALQMILKEKRKTYKNKLARTMDDESLKKVRILTRQRDQLVKKVRQIEIEKNALALATAEEQEKIELLRKSKERLKALEGSDEDIAEAKNKYRLLHGRLLWQVETDYPVRIWKTKRQLQQLDEAIREMNKSMQALRRAWNTAPADFSKFDARIANKEDQIRSLRRKVDQAVVAQGQQLRMMALEELRLHRNQIKLYHDRALYAKARVYDSMMAHE